LNNELWIPRKQRLTRAYQPRYRKPCLGELIQIDGSPHCWFEHKDDEQYSLLLAVDDATSKIWLRTLRYLNLPYHISKSLLILR
tara:strand:- start:6985 stop:7236 length:252 start_codon:yes stop_codon:yes gene_type:complete